jgi:hypothetical protein
MLSSEDIALTALDPYLPTSPKGTGFHGENGFIYEIETVRKSSLDERLVYISGWCFSEDFAEIAEIRCVTEEDESIGNYGIKRSELMSFGEKITIVHSGFDLSVPMAANSVPFSLEVKKMNSRSWSPFVEGTLTNAATLKDGSKLNKAMNGDSYRVNHGFNFQLDEPEKYKSNGYNTRLRGWCFSIDGAKIINIRGKTGDKLVESQYLIERRELDYMFELEDEILHSGFELLFSLPPGSTSITIEAQMENTKWVAVTHLCLCKPLLFGKTITIHE